MQRRIILRLTGAFLAALAAAVFGLGSSIQSKISPTDQGSRIHGLYADGWLAQGAEIRLRDFAPYVNYVEFAFNAWRPDATNPARLKISLCGEIVSQFLVDNNSTLSLRLSHNCADPRLTIEAENPFTASEQDTRELAVQIREIRFFSLLGVPVVRVDLLLFVTLAALLLLSTLILGFKGGFSMVLSAAGAVLIFHLIRSAPDLNLTLILPLYLFLLAAGIGLLFAVLCEKTKAKFERTHTSEFNFGFIVCAVLATIGGLILRLYGIDFGFPENFHPDEIPKVNAVTRMMQNGTLNPEYFLHPSLLLYSTYAMHSLLLVFGASGETRDVLLIAGRSVSVIAGCLSIYLTALIGRRLFTPATGILAASLLAVFPLHVTCSRYLKEDALLLLFVLLCVNLVLKAVENNSRRTLCLAAFVAGLSASSKYSGLLSLAFIVGAPWIKSRALIPDWRWVSAAVMALLFFPIGFLTATPYSLLDYQEFQKDFAYESRHMERGHASAIDAWSQYWMYYFWRAVLPGVSWPAAVAAVAIMGLAIRRRSIELLFLSGAILLFYLPAEWVKAKPAPQPDRYILPCLPFIALGCAALCIGLYRARFKILSVTFAAVALAFPLSRTVMLAKELSPDTRIKMRDWVSANIPAGSRILLDWAVYSPALPEVYHTQYMDRAEILQNLRPTRLRASGFDYLLVSSLFYTRYTEDPNPGVPGRAIVRELFQDMPIVHEVSSECGTYGFHNPRLTLFKLR